MMVVNIFLPVLLGRVCVESINRFLYFFLIAWFRNSKAFYGRV
jgi:hypothetical protein